MAGIGDLTSVPSYMAARVQIKQTQLTKIVGLENDIASADDNWHNLWEKIKEEEERTGKPLNQRLITDLKKRAKVMAMRKAQKIKDLAEAKKYLDVIETKMPPAESVSAQLVYKDGKSGVSSLYSRAKAKLKR